VNIKRVVSKLIIIMNYVITTLLLVLFATNIIGLKPGMKNALRNQVVIDFKNAIVPIISKQVEHLTLPDVHTKSSGFDIDVTNIQIHINPFGPNQITIQFMPGTSQIRFGGNGFGMGGSAHIHAKWHFISKSMNADVSVNDVGFAAQITLLSNAGKPNIHVDSVGIGLSGGNVHIHIGGDIINKIIEFVANLLKGHIVKEVVGQLQSKIPPLMTTEVNNRLNTLQSDVDVAPHLNLKYSYPYASFVRGDYLFTGINAYIHPKGNPNPPPYEPKDMPEFDPANPKGVQFFISDFLVKSSTDAVFSIGLFTMSFEKDMLGHHVKMDCKATNAPGFAFNNAIDVTLSASCNVIFDNNPANVFTLEADVHVNLKEYMKQAVIFFTIIEAKFTKLEYHQDHPVDIEWFKNGINTVLQVIIEIVNGDLGQRGIPLPVIHGIDYTDTAQYVKDGYMVVGTNPVFHF